VVCNEFEDTESASSCQLERFGEGISENPDYTPGMFIV
jgi:hypothetical protein